MHQRAAMAGTLLEAARSIKTLRSLAASDEALCGAARSALESSVETLQRRSRQQRNLHHSVHALLRKTGVTLRLPCELCTCPDPSVPPAALRQFLGMYAAMLTELRGRPCALGEIVHRGGGPPEPAVQLLLCFVFGHLWQPDEEAALLDVAERLLILRAQEAGAAAALDTGMLPERLLSAYLRVMPGGAAWLQAALGSQVQRVVEESERGLCLMADAMDAYLSLPAGLKAEVDRDVERGEVAALGEHLHVVEVLSARGAALCTSCEALLEGVLRAAPAAPAGLRRIARALRGAALGEGEGGGAGGGAEGGAAGEGAAQLAGLSVRDMKAMLAAAGVDASSVLEKAELISMLQQHSLAPPPVEPPPPALLEDTAPRARLAPPSDRAAPAAPRAPPPPRGSSWKLVEARPGLEGPPQAAPRRRTWPRVGRHRRSSRPAPTPARAARRRRRRGGASCCSGCSSAPR